MSFFDKWNKAKFNVYESEEKTVLKLLEKIGDFIREMAKGIDNKTDLYGDHKGSWQGLQRPTLSEEGMRATVEKHITEIADLKSEDEKIYVKINEQDTKITNLKTRYDNFIGNALFLSEYPNHNDYSTLINDFCNTNEDVLIVCENRKEYRFNTPLNFKGRVLIEGNDSLWRYMGTSQTFIKFNQAPWQTEGSVIKDIKFWCNEKSVGAYQEKYCFFIEGYHISLKFHNLCVYNFGYPWYMKDTDVNATSNPYHTFGHSITECNVWGFICAINSKGNAEQVLVEHCWFDDGKRTSGSQNAAIRVEDATSFWIRNCIIQNADIGVLFRGVINGEISGCHFENMISASIWMYPASAYDNRNNLIINNFIVGHKAGIYFYVPSSAYTKNIHTTIIGNYFAFLGEGATECLKKANATSESHTLMINNSKLNGDWNWYGSSMTTLKEFQ